MSKTIYILDCVNYWIAQENLETVAKLYLLNTSVDCHLQHHAVRVLAIALFICFHAHVNLETYRSCLL